MGEVWKGIHTELEMHVAIKTLLQQNNEELLRRFRREAKLMAKTKHPNIVQILDYGVLKGHTPCIVMEFLEGVALEDYIEQAAPLHWREVAAIGAQLFDGLNAMHQQGVVHRDIKPANVMLSNNQQILKIVDFGIARPSSFSKMEMTKLTQTGMLIGTPMYMAPEQLMGMDIGAHSDVYAAGIMLYELLTKSIPHGDASMSNVMSRLRFPAPRLEPGKYGPASLSDLLAQLLEIDLTQRPSAQEAASSFRRILQGTPFQQEARHAGGTHTPPAMAIKRPRRGQSTQVSSPALAHSEPNQDPAQTDIFKPQSTKVDTDETRIYAVIVAKIPPSRLRQRDERAWLKTLLGDFGIGFSLGAQFWIALIKDQDKPSAKKRSVHVRKSLEEHFGEHTSVRGKFVNEDFVFTAATLSGAAQLPPEISSLIRELS